MALKLLKMGRNGQKWTKMAQKMSQNASKMSQKSQTLSQHGPKIGQNSKNRLKWLKKGDKMVSKLAEIVNLY